MELVGQDSQPEGAYRRHRPRLRRAAARASSSRTPVSARSASTSTSARSTRSTPAARTSSTPPTRRSASLVTTGRLVATNDFSVLAELRHDQHLRADAAPEDERPGHDVHPGRGRRDQEVPPSRPARDPRVDDLSGDDRRGRAARRSKRSASKVGQDFFLAFSPERIDPGNKQYQTRNIPKVVGGVTRALHAGREGALRAEHRHGGAGVVDAGRRDGEAPREHLPEREHRAR